jgi:hypothetical protein
MSGYADEQTIHQLLVSGAKEGMSRETAADTAKRIIEDDYTYVGSTPIEQFIGQDWATAEATAKVEASRSAGSLSSEDIVRDAKKQGWL